MEAEHKELLLRKRLYLLQNLDLQFIIPIYLKEKLIQQISADRILNHSLKWDRNAQFLDYLPRLGPLAFPLLLDNLKIYQPQIYTELTGDSVTLCRAHDKEKLFQPSVSIDVIMFVCKKSWNKGVEVVEHIEKLWPEKHSILLAVEDIYDNIYGPLLAALPKKPILLLPLICETLLTDYRSQIKIYCLYNRNHNINLKTIYLQNYDKVELFQDVEQFTWSQDLIKL